MRKGVEGTGRFSTSVLTGVDDFQESIDLTNEALAGEPERVQRVAKLLWGLEGFSVAEEIEEPAPLHIDLAIALIEIPGAAEKLLALLKS